jgi:septal ring factor EnvC (AmiA/AmiB activator)
MTKPTKVKYNVNGDDCRSDDDNEEYTKEELMDICEQVHTCFEMKRKECKELHKRTKSLEQSFDELNATHESLREDHEKLGKAHYKLEKTHSSLLKQFKEEEAKKEQVIVSCNVGLHVIFLMNHFISPLLLLPLTLLVALLLPLHL